MPMNRKVPSYPQAPCAALQSFPHPNLKAENLTIAQDHTSFDIAEVRACLEQQQLLDVTRQMFAVARTRGDASFKRLLRRKRTGAESINFQYRTQVAEDAGSNLWPWYWCIDTRDALALCWRAPPGVEPETGDTLIMIALKLGMEEHVKHLLDHRALDLDIRNSSGRDVAAVAARCGRDSLTSQIIQQARFNSAQRRRERRVTQTRQTRKRAKQGRGMRQRRRRFSTPRGLAQECSREDSVSSSASLPRFGTSTRIDSASPGDKATAGVPSDDAGDDQGRRLDFGSEERFQKAAEEALRAIMAISSVPSNKLERKEVGDGTESTGEDTAGGCGKKTVGVDGAEQQPILDYSRKHPQPHSTRAIAVQTDFIPNNDRGISPAGQEGQSLSSEVIETPPALIQERNDGGARLQRESIAPGDVGFHAVDVPHLSSFGAADAIEGGEQSEACRNLHEMKPALGPVLLENVAEEEEHSADTDDSGQSRPGSSSSVVPPAGLNGSDGEKWSAAHAGERKRPSHHNADQTAGTEAPEPKSTAAQQQGECNRSGSTGEEDFDAEKEALPSVDGSEIDKVTRQLQLLLREDALQDDGTLDYSATFELFDVDHDGNATPEELHSLFLRLGMRNLLPEEDVGVIVERVPRSNTGLITKKELQIFADRPGDLPWMFRRDSGSNVAAQGVQSSEGVGSGSTVSLVLHELQVKAVSSVSGVFWKKAPPKDLSSVSLFVRVTRGGHVAESAAVHPRLMALDGSDGGGDDEGVIEDSSKRAVMKKNGRAIWSWEWCERMVLSAPVPRSPAVPLHGGSAAEDSRAGENQVTPAEEQHKAGVEGRDESGCLADSRVWDAASSDRSRGASLDESHLNIDGAPSDCELDSSATAAGSGGVAVDDLQQGSDDSFFSDSEVRPSKKEGQSVVDTTPRQDEPRVARGSSEEHRLHTSGSNEPNASNASIKNVEENGEVRANSPAPDFAGGAKRRRGMSFWSPTTGRRIFAAARKTIIPGTRSSPVDSSSHAIEAMPTTPDFTAGVAERKPVDRRPSVGSEGNKSPHTCVETASSTKTCAKGGGDEERSRADDGTASDSSNSLESCTEPPAPMADMQPLRDVVVDGAKVDVAEGSGGVVRRRGLSFWGMRKLRRDTDAKTSAGGFVRKSSEVEDSNDHGVVTVPAANVVEGTPSLEVSCNDESPRFSVASETDAEGAVDQDQLEERADSGNGGERRAGDNVKRQGGNNMEGVEMKKGKTSPGGLLKRSGASFWSLKRTGRKRTVTSAGSDVSIIRTSNGGEDGRASDDFDAPDATPGSLVPNASTKRKLPLGKRGGKIGPVPLKETFLFDLVDTLVLEIWEEKEPGDPTPCRSPALDVATPESCHSGVQPPPGFGPNTANSRGTLPPVAEAPGQPDSGGKVLSARSLIDNCRADEPVGELTPPGRNYARTPGTVSGRRGDESDEDSSGNEFSIAEQSYADDGRTAMARGGVAATDVSIPAVLTASVQKTLREEPSLLSSRGEGKENKIEASSRSSALGPPERLLAGRRKSGSRVGEVHNKNATVQEECDADDDGGDIDDDVSVVSQSQASFESDEQISREPSAKQAQNGRQGRRSIFTSPFTSPFKGRKTNREPPPVEQPTSHELTPCDRRPSGSDLSQHSPHAEGGDHPRSAGSSHPARLKSVLWGRLTVPVAGIPSTERRRGPAMNDEHGVGGFGLGGGDDLMSKSNSDRWSGQPPSTERGGGPSSTLGIHLPGRDPKRQARGQAGIIGDRVDGISGTFANSAVDTWFDVMNPKGKHGNRVKGRVRLTCTVAS